MFRIIFAFLVVFGIFFFGINALRETTGKQRWALTKLVGYSILCAVLTTAVLIIFVTLF